MAKVHDSWSASVRARQITVLATKLSGMSEPEGTFAVVKLPNGTWVGAHASGRRIEIRDWTDIDRARARWHLAPRWAADGLYVFSE